MPQQSNALGIKICLFQQSSEMEGHVGDFPVQPGDERTTPYLAGAPGFECMSRSYVTLAEHPTDMVRLACTKCERRGQYPKATP
jgi:hypothetical protein